MNGIELIAKERERQISAEGWTPEHDDEHVNDELARAAMCYADPMSRLVYAEDVPAMWPWESHWWKPGETRISDLVKAGALIAAEIDRVLREIEPKP